MNSENQFVATLDEESMARLTAILKKMDVGTRALDVVQTALGIGLKALAHVSTDEPAEGRFVVMLNPGYVALLNMIWEIREEHIIPRNRNPKIKYVYEALCLGLVELGRKAQRIDRRFGLPKNS